MRRTTIAAGQAISILFRIPKNGASYSQHSILSGVWVEIYVHIGRDVYIFLSIGDEHNSMTPLN
jgi:hypothetical protein